MKNKILKITTAALLIVAGGSPSLQAATIDLGLQLVPDNILVDSAGNDLGNGAVFIGSWKDGVTDYSAALASVISSASLLPDPVAGLGSALSSVFSIGVSQSWSVLSSGSSYFATLNDTGLASRFADVVFFNEAASVFGSYNFANAEYGSIRWNTAWPGTEDLSRATDVALVVPSLDPDAAASVLVGTLDDNGDGTGSFQTIPEPSTGLFLLGAGCLWFATRSFKNKS